MGQAIIKPEVGKQYLYAKRSKIVEVLQTVYNKKTYKTKCEIQIEKGHMFWVDSSELFPIEWADDKVFTASGDALHIMAKEQVKFINSLKIKS